MPGVKSDLHRLLSSSLLLALALGTFACGDDPEPSPGGEETSAQPPDDEPATTEPDDRGGPTERGPFETWFDDQALLTEVSSAATSGDLSRVEALDLPPRCSRVRVAVTALHWHLTSSEPGKPALSQLFDALDALARASGGADAEQLPEMVAAWREWTDEQLHAEVRLAGAASLARAVLTGDEPPDPAKLRETLSLQTEPPPRSPGGALFSLIPAALMVVESRDGGVPDGLTNALGKSRVAFHRLGWPGGHATVVEAMAERELRERRSGALGSVLLGAALESYREAGDSVRLAELYLDQARVVFDPDQPRQELSALQRAATMSQRALEALDSVGCRGRELYETAAFHGLLLQTAGRQRQAVVALERALAEARYARLGAWLEVSGGAVLARSLVKAGDPARGAATADQLVERFRSGIGDPLPRQLDVLADLLQTAAAAHDELGAHDAARERHLQAAEVEARLERRVPELRGKLLAARSSALAGRAKEAEDEVAALLQAGVPPAVFAQAVEVLIAAGSLEPAERALGELARRVGPEQAPALEELRGRLLVARGDHDGAARSFGAFRAWLLAKDDPSVAPLLARSLLEWSESEEAAGRPVEAEQLAWEVAVVLQPYGWSVELDEARRRFGRLARERGSIHRALKGLEPRVAEPPLSREAHAEAVLDLFLVQLELLAHGNAELVEPLTATVGRHPDPDVATFLGEIVTLHDPSGEERPAPPTWTGSGDARLTLLADVAALAGETDAGSRAERALELAASAGRSQPELRRLAAQWGIGAATDLPADVLLRLVEWRRGTDPVEPSEVIATLADGESLVVYERVGPGVLLVVDADGVRQAEAPARADVVDLWNVAYGFEPDRDVPAAELMERVGDRVLGAAAGAGPVTVAWDSVLGPLPVTGAAEREVLVVASASERVRAADRPATEVEFLPHHTAESPGRYALVGAGELSVDARRRVVAAFTQALTEGRTAWDAFVAARALLRDSGGDGVPPAKRVFLRGAR